MKSFYQSWVKFNEVGRLNFAHIFIVDYNVYARLSIFRTVPYQGQGQGEKHSLKFLIEISCLTSRFCSNFVHNFIVDDNAFVYLYTFKYFHGRTPLGAGSMGEILFYLFDWNHIYNETILLKFWIQVSTFNGNSVH